MLGLISSFGCRATLLLIHIPLHRHCGAYRFSPSGIERVKLVVAMHAPMISGSKMFKSKHTIFIATCFANGLNHQFDGNTKTVGRGMDQDLDELILCDQILIIERCVGQELLEREPQGRSALLKTQWHGLNRIQSACKRAIMVHEFHPFRCGRQD